MNSISRSKAISRTSKKTEGRQKSFIEGLDGSLFLAA